jgi:hypothetical protein
MLSSEHSWRSVLVALALDARSLLTAMMPCTALYCTSHSVYWCLYAVAQHDGSVCARANVHLTSAESCCLQYTLAAAGWNYRAVLLSSTYHYMCQCFSWAWASLWYNQSARNVLRTSVKTLSTISELWYAQATKYVRCAEHHSTHHDVRSMWCRKVAQHRSVHASLMLHCTLRRVSCFAIHCAVHTVSAVWLPAYGAQFQKLVHKCCKQCSFKVL